MVFKKRGTSYFGDDAVSKWKEVRDFSFLKNTKNPNFDIEE